MVARRLRVGVLQLRSDPEVADHELRCLRRVGRLGADEVVPLRGLEGVERLGAEWGTLGALVIGGSKHSVVGPPSEAWSRLRRLLPGIVASSVPCFGSCFGYHALTVVLGGEVRREPASKEIGTRRLTLTPHGQRDPVFSALPKRFNVQAGHHDSVVRLPPGAVCLAAGAVPLQAARFGPLVYGTQYHSELTARAVRERMERYRDADFAADRRGYRAAVAALRPSPAAGRGLRGFLRLARASGSCGPVS